MITKDQFVDSLVLEISIIRHLGTKVDASMLDYKPTEKQRTLLELMNFLGHIFSTAVTANSKGDSSLYGTLAKEAAPVTLENFDSVMATQAEKIKEIFSGMSDEDLNKDLSLWGRSAPVSIHMMSVLKWATSYKMQMFLYIKACGKHELSTMNLWAGMDPAPKE